MSKPQVESDALASKYFVLAVYNSERARGILHAEAWQALMAEEQAAYDRERAEREGSSR